MKKSIRLYYEFFMAFCALAAVILAAADLLGRIPAAWRTPYLIADAAILLIFTVDYFVRLIAAKDKAAFFRDNLFDLIAIIPFHSLFRALRFVRFFRMFKLLRAAVFFRRFHKTAVGFFHTNGFNYILYITLVCLFSGALLMYLLPGEAAITSYSDALWWAFVTVTTVGYGDISPVTLAGRATASVLMIVGIGFISMLTGTVATYFVKKVEQSSDREEQVLDLSALSEDDFLLVKRFSEFVRSGK